MDDNVPVWRVHSVLLCVRDLDRSSTFYQAVLRLSEVLREGTVAVLGDEKVPFSLFLRAEPGAVHFGPEALGVRSLTYDVGSLGELDRVEKELRALDEFRDNESPSESAGYRWARGYGPDRFPLAFLAYERAGKVSLADVGRATARMYAMDV